MQHIVNIAFDFDDQTIKKKIEEDAYNDILNMIREDIQKVICSMNYWNGKPNVNDISPLKEIVREEVRNVLAENKETIIQAAAEGLVESVKRTKKFKEAVNEVIGE